MIKPKKSLGQNFLIDKKIIDTIIDIIEIRDKFILEVGPGTGNLTSSILKKKPKKLILVEKDESLITLLKDKFHSKVITINKDILKIDENLIEDKKLIVFGNLPYNISTGILSKWILNLKEQPWFECLILMFQKEVADRIIANFNTKNYGRLSILTNWRLNVEKICDVKPSSFFPVPKVDSSVLFFKPKKNFFKLDNPKNLEKVTRVFFMHRRKMIKKAYNQIFNGNINVSSKLNIDLNSRPQNLDYETYFSLTKEYEFLRG